MPPVHVMPDPSDMLPAQLPAQTCEGAWAKPRRAPHAGKVSSPRHTVWCHGAGTAGLLPDAWPVATRAPGGRTPLIQEQEVAALSSGPRRPWRPTWPSHRRPSGRAPALLVPGCLLSCSLSKTGVTGQARLRPSATCTVRAALAGSWGP